MHGVMWTLVFVFVSFIFFSWGMKSSFTNRKDPNTLAQVGEEIINYADFNKVYQPAMDKLYNAKEESPNPSEIKKLKEQVLEKLVDEAVLRQVALKLGLSVPDDELMGFLQHQNYFLNETGKFDKKKYMELLEANHFKPEDFENSQRQDILLQKIRSILMDGVLFTNEDLKNFAVFLGRDLKAVYVSIDPEKYEKKIQPSSPDLKAYYENNKNRYDHVERAKVRHILINLQGNESTVDQEKAKKNLEQYRNEILAKKKSTFEETAKKFSQDGGSKDKGGELGWISRNGMGKDFKEFEDAVFRMKKGEISQPVKTKFGYHLVQLEDHEKEYKSVFEEVKTKVLKQYQKEKATQQIINLSEQLVEKLKNKEDLIKAADSLALEVTSTSWFTRDSGIPMLKDSKELSGELATLYPNQWKGPLELDQTEYFFQLTDARENKVEAENSLRDDPGIERKLLSFRQDIWLKDYLADQRKKLRVKTFLNS